MKLIQTFFFSVIFGCFLFAHNANKEAFLPLQASTVRLLLAKNVNEALVEVRGSYRIINPSNRQQLSFGLTGKRYLMHPAQNAIKWGETFPGIHQITIVPRSPTTKIFINGIQYDGTITVYKVGPKIQIVNELPVESYIKALLSQEFSFPLENEVMAALAIAARTTAYFQIHKNQTAFWDIEARKVGYMGSALIVDNSEISQAIDRTKNLIMVYSNKGQPTPFFAPWTEHSGGKTASISAIFRKDILGPEKSIEAAHAALDRERSKWTFRMSKQTLAQILHLNEIQSIDLFIDNESQKIYGIRIRDANNRTHDFDFLTFQGHIGKESVLSNDFTLSVLEDQITFNGYGKGHGVGLCVYSASAMAQNGELANAILSKFYANTQLINVCSK